MRLWIHGAACVAGLAGCAGPIDLDAGFLRPGMTGTQVHEIVGAAQNIRARGKRQIWQYCRTDLLGWRHRGYLNVLLVHGRLDSFRAYRGDAMGRCEDFYSAFSWRDLPEFSRLPDRPIAKRSPGE